MGAEEQLAMEEEELAAAKKDDLQEPM